MEHLGQLLPLWLLGAPLVLGIVERMSTPRADTDTRPSSMSTPRHAAPL